MDNAVYVCNTHVIWQVVIRVKKNKAEWGDRVRGSAISDRVWKGEFSGRRYLNWDLNKKGDKGEQIQNILLEVGLGEFQIKEGQ